MRHKKLTKNDAPKNITDHERSLKENDFIVSKTDPKGIITYGNRIFVEISGYAKEEIIGANHNLIRHPFMPKIAFKLAWDLIQQKKEFFGFVKNLSKDGGFYWVFAYITPDLDTKGNIIGYTSVRRKPSPRAVEEITGIYKLLNDAESRGGMKASEKLLNDYLNDNKTTYEKFVHELQMGAIA
ncbi:MAG: PAS sensor protein [Campylobacteraceae bacterium 4484_4]|nr:MAG: PAS sensor protein [Campylobacteraceae bacterium 4484_4]